MMPTICPGRRPTSATVIQYGVKIVETAEACLSAFWSGIPTLIGNSSRCRSGLAVSQLTMGADGTDADGDRYQ